MSFVGVMKKKGRKKREERVVGIMYIDNWKETREKGERVRTLLYNKSMRWKFFL